VELHGNGLVIQQIPAAGESVPEHGPIRLTLARPREFTAAGTDAGAGGRSPGARESR